MTWFPQDRDQNPLILAPNDNAKVRSGAPSAVSGCSAVLLLDGHLQDNTRGRFWPRGASGVRMSAGIGINGQEIGYLCVWRESVWWLYGGLVALVFVLS